MRCRALGFVLLLVPCQLEAAPQLVVDPGAVTLAGGPLKLQVEVSDLEPDETLAVSVKLEAPKKSCPLVPLQLAAPSQPTISNTLVPSHATAELSVKLS